MKAIMNLRPSNQETYFAIRNFFSSVTQAMHVCDSRELDRGSVFIKIGVDNGKGLLKVTLSVYTWPTTVEDKCAAYSGNLKAMVLATCQASETVENLRKLFTFLRPDTIEDFFMAGDLKVINRLSGIGAHSSLFAPIVRQSQVIG